MPASTTRSETRTRPGDRRLRAGGAGSKGATRSHRPSGTRSSVTCRDFGLVEVTWVMGRRPVSVDKPCSLSRGVRGLMLSSTASVERQYSDAGGGGEDHEHAAADEDGGGTGPVEEEASDRGSRGGCQEYGAARSQNCGERVSGYAVLDQGEGKRGVGAVDESSESKADQGGEGGVREGEGEHGDAVARDDAEHGRPQGRRLAAPRARAPMTAPIPKAAQ